MAVYRYVRTEFWKDPKVIDEMTPEDKLFFLYILTNTSTTQIGIYTISKKQMAFELGYSTESVTTLIDRFENYYKIIKYNPVTKELAIKNWGKYNLNKGGKPVIDCVKKEILEVKDKDLINFVSGNIPKADIKKEFDNVINESYHDTYHESSDNVSTIRGQKEKEKEKQKEKEKYKEEVEDDGYVVSKYAKLYQENIGVINGIVTEWLLDISERIDIDLFKKAIEIATNKGACNKGYVDAVIRNWANNNIHTYEQLKAYEVGMKHKGEQNNGKYKCQREHEEDESLNEKPTEEQLNETRKLLEKLQMRKMQR